MDRTTSRIGVAHVDHFDRRHAETVDPVRQVDAFQLLPGFGTRGRGAQHKEGFVRLRPLASDLPGVVAWVALLLVGRVVLLVDHNQPEVVQRSEDRRPRADADRRLAGPEPLPFVEPLSSRKRRMEDRYPVAEPGLETADRLRGESDLRHQHDRRLAASQDPLDQGQIDLGLAGTGHPGQQRLRHSGGIELPGQVPDRGRLISGQLGRICGGRADDAALRPAAHPDLFTVDQATFLEAFQSRAVGSGASLKLTAGHLALKQRGQDKLLLRTQSAATSDHFPAFFGEAVQLLHPGPGALATGAGAGRQHQAEAAGRRRAVLAGDPGPELDQLRRRARTEDLDRLGQAIGRHLGGLGDLDDDAQESARTERHLQHVADFDAVEPFRNRVVERSPERAGCRQRLDPGDGHRSTLWPKADGSPADLTPSAGRQ